MAEYIAPIQRLIEEFKRLPGVGSKTAARFAFSVLGFTEDEAARFADAINGVKRDVFTCPVCYGLSTKNEQCDICSSPTRDQSLICVVENPKDVITMERIRGFKGVYHVLGGTLSPIDNITPDDLNISELIERVESGNVSEVVIATNLTPSGDTTATYLAKILKAYDVKVSRLAYGVPVGGDIEYTDVVTLRIALEGRRYYNDNE